MDMQLPFIHPMVSLADDRRHLESIPNDIHTSWSISCELDTHILRLMEHGNISSLSNQSEIGL